MSALAKLVANYPPATRGTVVVWGLLADSPFGGMVWQVLHYVVPLRQMGFDVWYVEESERYMYDLVTYEMTTDYEPRLTLVSSFLDSVGLADRWVFRRPYQGICYGALDAAGLEKLYTHALAGFNLCGSQEPHPWHQPIERRVYVETDPVRNQVSVASGDQERIVELDAFNYHFTYGENLGADDCRVPMGRYKWRPTRPPVIPEWWHTDAMPPEDAAMTSIANWKHAGKDVVWQGQHWRWSKHHNFLQFIDLPNGSALPLQLAVGAIGDEDRAKLKASGWRISASARLEPPQEYRQFVQRSLGEITVAKDQYATPRSGWFSDRSVCYLAAGRPVVTQSTAFEKFIPTGEGLFAFDTREAAHAALEEIAADFPRHSQAAAEIAREYFAADKVIGKMLSEMGLN